MVGESLSLKVTSCGVFFVFRFQVDFVAHFLTKIRRGFVCTRLLVSPVSRCATGHETSFVSLPLGRRRTSYALSASSSLCGQSIRLLLRANHAAWKLGSWQLVCGMWQVVSGIWQGQRSLALCFRLKMPRYTLEHFGVLPLLWILSWRRRKQMKDRKTKQTNRGIEWESERAGESEAEATQISSEIGSWHLPYDLGLTRPARITAMPLCNWSTSKCARLADNELLLSGSRTHSHTHRQGTTHTQLIIPPHSVSSSAWKGLFRSGLAPNEKQLDKTKHNSLSLSISLWQLVASTAAPAVLDGRNLFVPRAGEEIVEWQNGKIFFRKSVLIWYEIKKGFAQRKSV